jgi:phospholipid-transporting ATPase
LSSWNLVFFSLLYTSLPTIAVGVLDQDVSAATLHAEPHLYAIGQDDVTYNRGMFWATMADMLWQSLVLFFGPYFTFFRGSPSSFWEVGNLWCLLAALVVTLHLAMDVYHWTAIHHAVVWLSLIITVGAMLVLDAFPASQQYG